MQDFTTTLTQWYHINKRDLPWRKTKDPYKIWLSEIILQQTRVAQGIDYYKRFVTNFETIIELAQANEDEVLKLWQGLGYYSRARNLHHTAQSIVKKYDGKFPETYGEILQLKGIGPYTAAAIASIAYSLPQAVVDGNVYRVLSRYFGIETPIDSGNGKKVFFELAQELLDKADPGNFNQAIMEFGAMQCIPKNPHCEACPLQNNCVAFSKNSIGKLPVKAKKTKQTERYFYYYLIEQGETIFLEKRIQNDIWKNLYQFPLLEKTGALDEAEILSLKVPFILSGAANLVSISKIRKHILSHQIIRARVIRVEISHHATISKDLIPVNKKDISKFAVPRLLEFFLKEFGLNA